jgi:uncharacterized membrane protein YdjX (TVP38/TMEM64 family)
MMIGDAGRAMAERQRRTFGDPARAFKGAPGRALLLYAGIAVLLVAALVVAGQEIGRHLQIINASLASLGAWGVLVYAGLFIVATSVFVPETALAITAGALFGVPKGLAVVGAGGMVAAALQYLLSRWVLRSWIERTLAAWPSLEAVRQAVMRREVRLQALVRLTPLNPAMLNYLSGAAGVRFRGFLLASLAVLPHQAVEVYFGYAVRHVTTAARRTGSAVYLHDALVVGGLIMCVVVLALVARWSRKAAHEAMVRGGNRRSSEPGIAGPPTP